MKYFLLLCLLFIASPVWGQHIELPEGSVALTSPEGQRRLLESRSKAAYWPLSVRHETELGQSHCGPASCVMVLNAMAIPAPETLTHKPFHAFEQDNFFTPAVEKVLPESVLKRQGATLAELAAMLRTFGISARPVHASDSKVGEFRRRAQSAMASGKRFVIINFVRQPLNQVGGGHFCPLAAYHEDTDSFLVMDVARYKYPPFWVKSEALFRAMNTLDRTSGKSRGYILIERLP